MAIVTTSVPLDMYAEFSLTDDGSSGDVKILSSTSTAIVSANGNERMTLSGHFQYNSDHKLIAGTLTGLKFAVGSTTQLAFTNLDVDARDLAGFVNSSDGIGMIQHFMRGADTIQGSAFADKLYGWNSNDIVRGGGGNDKLFGGNGDDSLNGGTGVDSLSGNLGNDTYTLDDNDIVTEISGQGNDTVLASISYTIAANIENLTLTGSSVINGIGNALSNVITGNAGVNFLNGGSGNDSLNGGTGNDTLIGAAGNDRLTGGSGADKFRFNASLDGEANVDTVTDFSAVSDFLQLENAIFKKLTVPGALNAANFRANTTGAAVDANDFILYDTDSGQLFYDADGNGVGARVLFALIGTSTHAALTAADFVVI